MLVRGLVVFAGPVLLSGLLAVGCHSPRRACICEGNKTAPPLISLTPSASRPEAAVQQTSFTQEPAPIPPPMEAVPVPAETLQPQGQLEIGPLVAEVLARNPSLQAMVSAWRAAAARYPQAVSLEDPMFGFMIGPSALGHESGSDGYMLDASQKIPWHGKRYFRGQEALAEASAARANIGETRLRLVAATKVAFADYYLVQRLKELNRENTAIMRQFRETARVKYETNLVPQEDVLLAEVELAEIERKDLELERMEAVAVARINTLLHRAPDVPLPPPVPSDLPADVPLPEYLRQVALQRRPELAAEAARIRADQAQLALARAEYYPDVAVVGRYDAFWENPDLRPMVGMNLNVPIYYAKRDAAVREAIHRLNARRAEYEQRVDDINNEVQAAYEQVVETIKTLELYETRILPAAKQNVETAQTTYTTATLDFLRLIESQRRYILLQEKQREAEAQLLRWSAELEQAIGGPLEIPSTPEAVQSTVD